MRALIIAVLFAVLIGSVYQMGEKMGRQSAPSPQTIVREIIREVPVPAPPPAPRPAPEPRYRERYREGEVYGVAPNDRRYFTGSDPDGSVYEFGEERFDGRRFVPLPGKGFHPDGRPKRYGWKVFVPRRGDRR